MGDIFIPVLDDIIETQLSFVAMPTLTDLLKWFKVYHGCRIHCGAGPH